MICWINVYQYEVGIFYSNCMPYKWKAIKFSKPEYNAKRKTLYRIKVTMK